MQSSAALSNAHDRYGARLAWVPILVSRFWPRCGGQEVEPAAPADAALGLARPGVTAPV